MFYRPKTWLESSKNDPPRSYSAAERPQTKRSETGSARTHKRDEYNEITLHTHTMNIKAHAAMSRIQNDCLVISTEGLELR